MADLLTLAEYKGLENIQGNNTDALLENLISVVSTTIRTYCGRDFTSFYSTDLTEYFSFNTCMRAVFPREYPLKTVSLVRERKSPTSDWEPLEEDVDYIIEPLSDGIYRIGQDFPLGIKALEVTYQGGYDTVPEDLQLAAVHLVNYYKNKEWVQDKTAPGGFSLKGSAFQEEHKTDSNFPDHIRRILSFYRY